MTSKTTQSEKKCSLEDLQRPTMCATCYLAWMYPKTQSEAVKLIYNTKSVANVNQMPVIKTRELLLRAGYLKPVDGYKLRNQRFASTSLPYIEYLESELRKKKSRIKLTEKEKKAIGLIFDSTWFRSFFREEYLRNPKAGREISEVWNAYRTEKGRLIVDDVMYLIATLLGTIGATAFVVWTHLREDLGMNFRLTTVDELIEVGDFDRMISDYMEIDRELLKEMYLKLHKNGGLIGQVLVNHLDVGIMLIPPKIADLFMRAGRPQLTLLSWGRIALTMDTIDHDDESFYFRNK